MYKRILIATDGSEIAQRAVAHGLALAKHVGANVTVLAATDHWSALEMADLAELGAKQPIADYERRASQWVETVLAPCAELAAKAGVPCTTLHVADVSPAEAIVDTAKSKACDLIVMSSHGRSDLGRLLLGSVATTVLSHTSVPVLICR